MAGIPWEVKPDPNPDQSGSDGKQDRSMNQEAGALAAVKMLANRSTWRQSAPRIRSEPAQGCTCEAEGQREGWALPHPHSILGMMSCQRELAEQRGDRFLCSVDRLVTSLWESAGKVMPSTTRRDHERMLRSKVAPI